MINSPLIPTTSLLHRRQVPCAYTRTLCPHFPWLQTCCICSWSCSWLSAMPVWHWSCSNGWARHLCGHCRPFLFPNLQLPFKTGSTLSPELLSSPTLSWSYRWKSEWLVTRRNMTQAGDKFPGISETTLGWVETDRKYRRLSTFSYAFLTLQTVYHFIICSNQKPYIFLICFFLIFSIHWRDIWSKGEGIIGYWRLVSKPWHDQSCSVLRNHHGSREWRKLVTSLEVLVWAMWRIQTWSRYKNMVMVVLKQRRRQRHPTPALLPGKSHGWRSLVGCSPWGR